MWRLFVIGACVLLGTGALVFALRFGQRVSYLGPHGDGMMTVAALTLVLAYAAAIITFASWRAARRPAIRSDLNPGLDAENLRLGVKAGVYGLNPGTSYRVIREIKDCYGTVFPVGMDLTFVERHYLPYHGGHTVVFRPEPMYLQDEVNADVLNKLDAFLVAAGASMENGQPGY